MTPIAKVSELKDGDTVEFTYKGEPAILVKFRGQLYAYRNVCPHEGGPSRLAGEKIVCDWHFSEFKPETGERLDGPADPGTRLQAIPILVKDDSVTVEGT